MKFLRVNMTKKDVGFQDVPQKYQGLGGRGLTSIMINAEVPPECDPLGPENKLIFAPGLLSGTSLVNTSRLSVGAKSPLTGTIKESNVGGTVGADLAHLGITAIVVDGQASEGEWYILKINKDGQAELLPGGEYMGMRTYSLVDKLLQTFGKGKSVLCIGPAGEYRMGSASIQTTDVDDRPCRAAGRGGLGAVMGSKGIKAVIVERGGKLADPIADTETFRESAKVIAKAIRDNPFSGQLLPNLGTAGLVGPINSLGAFSSYNATQGVLDGYESISGEKMAEIIKERGGNPSHMGCAQCVIHCSNVYVDNKGKYITSSLEYETIWSMGGMTGIKDLDIIAKLDFLADDIGLDTINTGVAFSVAMDAGYKSFGDGQAAIEMMEEIARGSEIGRIFGNGPSSVGMHFNHHRVPAVKNQSVAAYDPRAMQGIGVTYATSPMGADHTAGNPVGAYLGGAMDPLSPDGQVDISRELQIAMASVDSTGLCLMASFCLEDPVVAAEYVKVINAKFGISLGPEDISAMGIRVLKAEREFNKKAGFTREDDRLPSFYYEEALPPHNKVFLISDDQIDNTFDF